VSTHLRDPGWRVSICHPGNPLAALSGRPEGDMVAVSTLVGMRMWYSPCPFVALFGPHAMSDLSPECAPKQVATAVS
jgi:hypothetical protein